MTIGDFTLWLICAHCRGRYLLTNTSGFAFADGLAIVSGQRVEVCPLCYHHHPAGTQMTLARVKEDIPQWVTS